MSIRPTDIEFDCKMLDFPCHGMESFAQKLGTALDYLSKEILKPKALEADGGLWTVALEEAGFWLGLAILVMIITSVVGVSASLVMGRPDLVKRSILGTLLSIPAVMLSYWAVREGLIITDQISDYLVERMEPGNIYNKVFGADGGTFVNIVVPQVNQGLFFLYTGVVLLGFMFVAFALAFRDFVLMLLIAFAPLAFILLPLQGGVTWVKRWVGTVVAMLLAKPLIMGTLVLVFKGFGNGEDFFSMTTLAMGIGLGISAFMPLMALSFFSFLGGSDASDAVAGRAGAASSQTVKQLPARAASVFGKGKGGPAPAAAPAVAGGAGAGIAAQTAATRQPETQHASESKKQDASGGNTHETGSKSTQTPKSQPSSPNLTPSKPPQDPTPPSHRPETPRRPPSVTPPSGSPTTNFPPDEQTRYKPRK